MNLLLVYVMMMILFLLGPFFEFYAVGTRILEGADAAFRGDGKMVSKARYCT